MNKVEISKKYKTRHGKTARVICTDAKSDEYPVVALVSDRDGTENTGRYTESGQYYANTEHIFDLIEVSPWDDFKVDEPVMVRDSADKPWNPRHFARVVDGKPCTWVNGKTSWSAQSKDPMDWQQCRRPTEEEMRTKATP